VTSFSISASPPAASDGTIAFTRNWPMLTWVASWNVVAAMPYSSAVWRSLKTLFPAASATSKTTSPPAYGSFVARFSTRALRCIVWPGWYIGLSDVSRMRTSGRTATSASAVSTPLSSSIATTSFA